MFVLVSPALFLAFMIGRLIGSAFVLLCAGALWLFSGIVWLLSFGYRHAQARLRRLRQRRALGIR
jgi:hypothetical protein